MAQGFLPYGRQTIDDDDVAAVASALKGDFLTTGPTVGEFERAFASATGASHAVASNSGTAALHLAAMAIDLGPGQAAVVPAVTFLATANVVRMTGAEVVLADVDPETGLLTPGTFAAALERAAAGGLSVTAALPVHLNGQVCDMAGIAELAEAKGIALIEDACHALGAADAGATRHSRLACFSTHPVKGIATGEGGVTTSSDPDLDRRMRELRSHGMVRDADRFLNHDLAFDDNTPNPWYYEMHEVGWNYRIPDVLCALGLSQLPKLPRFFARRQEIAARYDHLLAPLAPRLRPVPRTGAAHGWHLYAVLVDFAGLGTTRRRAMEALRARGVGTQVHYLPLNLQPYYRDRYGALDLPGARAYYERCLSIPLYPGLTEADVDRVAEALGEIAG